jgi:hypothetical protein
VEARSRIHLAFATKSYLRYEDGYYHFVTPDFYYEGGPLDVELSLTFPPNLVYLEANVEPSYMGDGVAHWSLADCSHTVVIAKFERVGPFVQPGQTGPEFQVDPSSLKQLTAEEIPRSADEVLKELENIIKVPRRGDRPGPAVMGKLWRSSITSWPATALGLPPAGRQGGGRVRAAGRKPPPPEPHRRGTLGTGAAASGGRASAALRR